jgi:hypothetical protein
MGDSEGVHLESVNVHEAAEVMGEGIFDGKLGAIRGEEVLTRADKSERDGVGADVVGCSLIR